MREISRRSVLKGLAGAASIGGVATVAGAQRGSPPELETIKFIFRRRDRPPGAGQGHGHGGGSGCLGGDQFKTIRGGVKWRQDTVTYSTDVPGYSSAVQSAFSTWASATGLTLQSSGSSQNTVTMASLSSGTLAVSSLTFNPATKEIQECDIEMNSNVSWSTSGATDECTDLSESSFDVQDVVTHEVGHFVGLDHVNDEYLTMYPYASPGETRKRTLGPGDRAGATALYG